MASAYNILIMSVAYDNLFSFDLGLSFDCDLALIVDFA